MARITKDEVYEVLSYTEWKTGREIEKELANKRKREQPEKYNGDGSIKIGQDISFGLMFTYLRDLREKGYAEMRYRKSEKRREFKRKLNGRRTYEESTGLENVADLAGLSPA